MTIDSILRWHTKFEELRSLVTDRMFRPCFEDFVRGVGGSYSFIYNDAGIDFVAAFDDYKLHGTGAKASNNKFTSSLSITESSDISVLRSGKVKDSKGNVLDNELTILTTNGIQALTPTFVNSIEVEIPNGPYWVTDEFNRWSDDTEDCNFKFDKPEELGIFVQNTARTIAKGDTEKWTDAIHSSVHSVILDESNPFKCWKGKTIDTVVNVVNGDLNIDFRFGFGNDLIGIVLVHKIFEQHDHIWAITIEDYHKLGSFTATVNCMTGSVSFTNHYAWRDEDNDMLSGVGISSVCALMELVIHSLASFET